MNISGNQGVRICDAFLQVAQATPNAVALREGQHSLTYAALERASSALASQLVVSVPAHSIVAIYGKRSAQLVLSMLACSRANMTFAVLDSAYPDSRIQQMLTLIEPSLVLVVDTDPAELKHLLGSTPTMPVTAQSMRASQHSAAALQPDSLAGSARPIAYLLFTSGTTGVPKCIQTSHAPLVHFVQWYAQRFGVTAADRFSMLSGLGHDPVMRDIFVPLSVGAELCIPDNAIIINPTKLFDWFRSERLSFAHATPQLLKILCAGARDGQRLSSLRHVFSGGDALRSSHAAALGAVAPGCQLVNFYGTTETPQAMAYYVLAGGEVDPIPVGHAIDDVTLHVLGDDYHPLATGGTGQIGIETTYLSNGYLHDDGMTQGRFVHLPNRDDGPQVYLTGDYGVMREDGALMLKGRMDDQVKVRGFRVELGEIVSALEAEPGTQGAVVLPHKDSNGETVLVAYLVNPELAARGTTLDSATRSHLRAALALRLPAYMVPARYVALEAFPLLPNGKLDRDRLPSAEGDTDPDQSSLDPGAMDDVSRDIVAGFESALGYKVQDLNASFVDHGGDSLSFIQASLSLEKVLGWLPDKWDRRSLRELATLKRDTPAVMTSINSIILVRALAIVLVVLDHFQAIRMSGETSALFVASGWSFGRYQIPAIGKAKSALPVLKLLFKIVLPVTLYSILLHAVLKKAYSWQQALLIDNFIDPNFTAGLSFWFIEDLVQILVIAALLFSIPRMQHLAEKNMPLFAFKAIVVCLAASFAINQFWNTDYLYNRVPHMSMWLFFIGMAISGISRTADKLLVVGIVAGAAALFQLTQSASFALPLFGLGAILLCTMLPQLKIPTWFAHAASHVAGASLFIYMTHFQFSSAIAKVLPNANPFVTGSIAILGGIAVWKLWEFCYRKAAALLPTSR